MASRRNMLKLVSGGGVAVFAGAAPGLSALAATVPVRREINSLKLNDPVVVALRDGVRILKARTPGALPTWTDMANIHGTSAGFNKCPHGNWYFLPWHRGYVTMYERMIRAVTGYRQFAMPYWDWSANRKVPQAFSDPTYNGQPNSLYEPTRNNNVVLTDDIVGPTVMNRIYGETNYELFGTSRPAGQNSLAPSWITTRTGTQGVLEATPHNTIHVRLGGWMPSPRSPMDPIFQMHHGNIDRIWWRWNGLGRQNTQDSLWQNMVFQNNYLTPSGGWWSTTPNQVQQVTALGYTYGSSPLRFPAAPVRRLSDQRITQIFARGSAGAAADLGVRSLAARKRTSDTGVQFLASAAGGGDRQALAAVAKPQTEATPLALLGSRAVALISGLTPPSDNVEVKVYVDGPNGGGGREASDPGYVTTIGFFGSGAHAGHGGDGGISASADLTETLQALAAAGVSTGDDIRVRLEAVDSQTGAPVPAAIASAKVEVVIV
ncbi:tyrosinase family protein [Caulobacter hibisci]|uniref:Tyrosinase family protein n=1 Tax=Caulobacter hibisci TaxID=2035993 RepID=A0ABS0T0L3_9CAUL|nr:tyrosinase family protein [Caulobacter hibisci]MBI1685403.1 tyrosinase family protein [Caulobacter hibisci]